MKFKHIAHSALFALSLGTLFAQWPAYPTGVPKTADGKPNLEAPAPRTADGKPDLTGIWDFRGRGGGPGGPPPAGGVPPPGGGPGNGPGRGPGGPGGPPPPGGRGGPPPPGAPPPPPQGANGPPPLLPSNAARPVLAPGQLPVATFANVGAGFPDGLPLRPVAAELVKRRMADHSMDNPDAHCLPIGLMQLHTHPQPRKIVQTPGLIVIMYESNSGLRQIFTDGRPLPPKDADPWWYGYSTGHWEGDTLVVETNGFKDDVWLDINGNPLTNAGKMTERFRRPNFGTLEIDVTIDDPTVYTKPWTVRVNQRLMADTDLIEFVCAENEKSVAHMVGK